jgi:hypothetical protein
LPTKTYRNATDEKAREISGLQQDLQKGYEMTLLQGFTQQKKRRHTLRCAAV